MNEGPCLIDDRENVFLSTVHDQTQSVPKLLHSPVGGARRWWELALGPFILWASSPGRQSGLPKGHLEEVCGPLPRGKK